MKIKKILFIILFFIALLTIPKITYSYTKLEGINNFPDSYKPYLLELQKKHPNWTFTALYINLDWKYAVDNENIFGKNLVPKSYSDSWKNTKSGQYNIEVDNGWVDCSRKAVEYTMDPRNFLYEERLFQFETLSYDTKSNNLDGIEKILYGTEFYNRIVEYKNSSGTNIVTNKKYSDLILTAGATSKVSSYHLASRIKQEVGPFLSHSSISGVVSGYQGLFNFYNIGATSSSEPMGAIINGLKYARDGKGASQTIRDKYIIPWNTKERAITGGGIFIGSSYINIGQNCIYLQKFDVSDERTGTLFSHQYMTNVLAPYSESRIIYSGYSNSGLLNSSMSFVIPVYNNMPSLPEDSPAISTRDFTDDNTKVYANVSGTLNIRTGPGTSYEILTSVAKNDVLTRIKKGKQSGDLWDKVILSNGMVGYVFQSYLVPVPNVEISSITLNLDKTTINKKESIKLNIGILPESAKNNKVIFSSNNTSVAVVDSIGNITGISAGTATITAKAETGGASRGINITVYSPVTDLSIDSGDITLKVGEKFKLNAIISPSDSSNKNVIWNSLDTNVATIDNDGNVTPISEGITTITLESVDTSFTNKKFIQITVIKNLEGIEIIFSDDLKTTGNIITGLDYLNTTVQNVQNKITTEYTIEMYNNKNELIKDNQNIGTGGRIVFKDTDDNQIATYNIVLYGDANGDGKINSIDLLTLQRHILKIQTFDGLFLKATNILKNNKAPSSLDLLKIQRHILKLEMIQQ